jgi:sulfide:quinone oxidoreductase
MNTKIKHQILIVGGGAGGIATAASLLKRDNSLDIAIIEPSETHYYQPGWTLVGGGVFTQAQTRRSMSSLIPKGVRWIRSAVSSFDPDNNELVLGDGERLGYDYLVVSPGLKLCWDKVEGLEQTLGKNGVTSNYRFDLAPYTWQLVEELKSGTALFTQPPMPIKCAGAPQKAMYLSCAEWFKNDRLKDIHVAFHNAGGVLFGVQEYVPALMSYIEKYDAKLCFNENLIAVDGAQKTATFNVTDAEGNSREETREFDMIHVCPPQASLDFVANSPLANEAGWVDVDQETLRHNRYANIWGLGDGCSAPNAKTAAAVRQQAPVVAANLVASMKGEPQFAIYTGYGSCPLTVERGKIVLAEFGYGGVLQPSFPKWMVDGTKATRRAWFLKETLLPPIYFHAMLKGREWLAAPKTK